MKAVIKSFDPGQRGWISACQLGRIYTTVGLNPPDIEEDEKISTEDFLKKLKFDQETELLELVSAGNTAAEEECSNNKTDSDPV